MRSSLIFLISGLAVPCSAQNPDVEAIIGSVKIDSMMLYVSELSGELPVNVGAGPELILSRHKFNEGNAKAQSYLEQKLVQFGYTPMVQTFGSTGRNVLVTKTGNVYPDEVVILCAHYDAMPGGNVDAPAADDDGSGCGALLEAARVLSDVEFEYTLVFAFWDEEEQGLVGSGFYAGGMAANDAPIRGVINMDAIAYDGNGDTRARIHTRPIANSLELADSVFAVKDHYGIDLDLLLTNPGATYSDHASFWNNDYGAILVIEEFTGDGNPFYHTPNDRVEHFDVPYYEKLAKLSIATTATIAVPMGAPQGLADDMVMPMARIIAYPNPTVGEARVWLDVPASGFFELSVMDVHGRQVAVIHEGMLPAGRNSFVVPMQQLNPGTYLLQARTLGAAPIGIRLVRTP